MQTIEITFFFPLLVDARVAFLREHTVFSVFFPQDCAGGRGESIPRDDSECVLPTRNIPRTADITHVSYEIRRAQVNAVYVPKRSNNTMAY